jgi:hypothetical protein
VDVPANSSVVVSFTLQVRGPGTFADSIPLYVDDGGLKEIQLSIKGASKPLGNIVSEEKAVRPSTADHTKQTP